MIDLKAFLSGGSNRIKLKRHEYVRAISISAAIFIMIFIFVLEIKHFHNTFNVSSLVVKALIFAAIVGAAFSYYLTKDKPKTELFEKFQLWVGIIVLSMVIMPPLASLTNRLFSFRSIQEEPVELVTTNAFFSSRFGQMQGEQMDVTGYYIFVIRNDEVKRIKSKTNPYEGAADKSQVLLPVKKGFWGYDYVSFKKK